MPTILCIVHCHVCPLKSICLHEASDDTYNFTHTEQKPRSWSLKRINCAKANCPLRKLLEPQK